jgi:hypothetical protein
MWVSKTATPDQMALYVSATAASAAARLAIYGDDGNGLPGAVLFDSGSIDCSASTGSKTANITGLTLTPGLYWIGGVLQGSNAATVYVNSTGAAIGLTADTAQNAITANNNLYEQTSVTGALPSTFTATPTLTSGTMLRVSLHHS